MKIKTYIPRKGGTVAVQAVYYKDIDDIPSVAKLLVEHNVKESGGNLHADGAYIPEKVWIIQPPFAHFQIRSHKFFTDRFQPLQSQLEMFSGGSTLPKARRSRIEDQIEKCFRKFEDENRRRKENGAVHAL